MRYERKDIRKDMWMQLDAPGQVIVKRSEPPKFGQSSEQLDAIKRKLKTAAAIIVDCEQF
jgi:hypothetical protein